MHPPPGRRGPRAPPLRGDGAAAFRPGPRARAGRRPVGRGRSPAAAARSPGPATPRAAAREACTGPAQRPSACPAPARRSSSRRRRAGRRGGGPAPCVPCAADRRGSDRPAARGPGRAGCRRSLREARSPPPAPRGGGASAAAAPPRARAAAQQPGRAEAIGDPARSERGERAQGADAELPQGPDQRRPLALAEAEAGDQGGDRERREELAQPGRGDAPLFLARREGREAGRRDPDRDRDRRRPARRREDPGPAPMDPAEPVDREKRLARPLGLERRADPLEAPQLLLPDVLRRKRRSSAAARSAGSPTITQAICIRTHVRIRGGQLQVPFDGNSDFVMTSPTAITCTTVAASQAFIVLPGMCQSLAKP